MYKKASNYIRYPHSYNHVRYKIRKNHYNNDIRKIDIRTDFDKGIYFKNDDSKYYTMESLEKVNKIFFDFLSASFNIDYKTMSMEERKAQQEKVLTYIYEKYGEYLDKLLEEYEYKSQETNKGQVAP